MTTENEQIVLNYIANHNTMVISTYGEDGPWSTPVFFVNRGYRLYFLSESTSIHSCNMRENTLVAATITEDYRNWSEIQGLQLKGQSYLVSGLRETAVILASFLKKFPAVKHLLQTPGSFKGVSKAQWYCIEPQYLKFTDNTTKFGDNFEINL